MGMSSSTSPLKESSGVRVKRLEHSILKIEVTLQNSILIELITEYCLLGHGYG